MNNGSDGCERAGRELASVLSELLIAAAMAADAADTLGATPVRCLLLLLDGECNC